MGFFSAAHRCAKKQRGVTPVSRFALLMGHVLKDVTVFLVSDTIVVVVANQGIAEWGFNPIPLDVQLIKIRLRGLVVNDQFCPNLVGADIP